MSELSKDTLVEVYMADCDDDEGVLKFLDSPECTLEMINYDEYDGWTALILAARLGRYEVVKKLIEKGADVNYINLDHSFNALMFSIYDISTYNEEDENEQLKLCQLLIDAGTDVHYEDRFSAFSLACVSNQEKIISLLLSINVNIDFRNEDGKLGEDHLKEDIDAVPENKWRNKSIACLKLVEDYRYRFKNKLEQELLQKPIDKKPKI